MFHVYLYAADGGPIASSFEAAAERLQQIGRLHWEPDGSFVWVDPDGDRQLDGMLYDAGDQIRYVDVRGRCLREDWKRILAAIDPSLTREAVVVEMPSGQRKDLQAFEESSWGNGSAMS